MNLIHLFARSLVFSRLKNINEGQIIIIDQGVTHRFGKSPNLRATIQVLDSRFYGELAFAGSIGAGESYILNYWKAVDLTKLIQIMVINEHVMDSLEGFYKILFKPFLKIMHYFNKNSVKGSRHNISKHYDLGNNFFKLFLDPTMMYSSAVFESSRDDLHKASLNKLKIICQKLNLSSKDHVIEIGSGWGGFAIYAAQHYKCKVTTTTTSKEQFNYVKERIKLLKLTDKITLLLKDYRELEGRYDKLVSIEMIEAVGHHFYNSFFKKCSTLLNSNGIGLIQAITIRDKRYEDAKNSVDYIQKYIFPGSCIPSITALQLSLTKSSDCTIYEIEDFGIHYAQTLKLWRIALLKKKRSVLKLGFDEQFICMWEFYLCYCEGGFKEKAISVIHMLITKPRHRNILN